MGKLFGTDGVRGIANEELTCELAFKIGQAGAYVLTKSCNGRPNILVGRDTRISGEMLENALIAGICSVGANAVRLGVVPTPAVAYLTVYNKMDAGVMISASHNPMEYNGIKYFSGEGYKLSDEIEEEIEDIILNDKKLDLPTGAGVGTVSDLENAVEDYINHCISTVDVKFDGMKIVIDCANGSSSVCAKKALEKLGAEVVAIHDTPDGTNINKDCGSTHMESLMAKVKEVGADIGLAFDGDADRLLACDENGVLVDGDKTMAICGFDMKANGKLKKDTIVATVMSNLGLFIACEQNGVECFKTKVGDRYVLEEMLKSDYSIGGEQSGHIIFLEYNTTGDGLTTAIQLLGVVKRSGKKLSELATVVTILPQVLINAKIKNEHKTTYMNDPEIAALVNKLEAEFSGNGRVLIRPSGTEPLVRVMIEGQDIDEITAKARELADLIESRLS